MKTPREEHCRQNNRCKYPKAKVCLMCQKESKEATGLNRVAEVNGQR